MGVSLALPSQTTVKKSGGGGGWVDRVSLIIIEKWQGFLRGQLGGLCREAFERRGLACDLSKITQLAGAVVMAGLPAWPPPRLVVAVLVLKEAQLQADSQSWPWRPVAAEDWAKQLAPNDKPCQEACLRLRAKHT